MDAASTAYAAEPLERRLLLADALPLSDFSGDVAGERASGWIPPTLQQQQWAYENMIVAQQVHLNDLAQARINAERQTRGEAGLAAVSSLKPGSGSEIEGATLAELARNSASVRTASSPDARPQGLPTAVDNSTLAAFPPIRSQGSLGSCASFAATYYTMTYMTGLLRGWDAKNDPADIHKFSPKWTYNLINGGEDNGSNAYAAYQLMLSNGAPTWAEFPYDSNFRAWCLDPDIWQNAIGYRMNQTGSVRDLDTPEGLNNLKTLLADGYALNFSTYINSWQFITIGDDPSTSADDASVGKRACSWVNGIEGPHAMTVVGYNDAIWVDVNGDGIADPGEKGAFRIANSWGDDWEDSGFTWLAYDALKAVSAVPGAPSAERQPAWWGNEATWITAKASYTPTLVAEFTLQHAQRDQLEMTVGSAASGTIPSVSWMPFALNHCGGAYGFDGNDYSSNPAAAPAATFAVDMTDVNPQLDVTRRYFLGLNDTTDPAIGGTLSAFRLKTPARGVVAVCPTGTQPGNVPQSDVDGPSIVYAFVDAAVSRVIYVDASAAGANNGSSWADAFVNLQTALAAATPGSRVLVADGTYKPTSTADRTISFQLTSGVAIYGGYAGYGAPNPDARDVDSYTSVLSGDIGISGDSSDNSYHVVMASGMDGTAVLDGFTITGGNANGSIDNNQDRGGGVYNEGTLVLTDVVVSGNTASQSYSQGKGGGVYNGAGILTVNGGAVSGNTASGSGAYGGGVYNDSGTLTLIDVIVSGNTASAGVSPADGYGGGVYNNVGHVTVQGGSQMNNLANGEGGYGGGVYNNQGTLTMTNVVVSGNRGDGSVSGRGGGIYNVAGTATIAGLTIADNASLAESGRGGGIYNGSGASLTMTDVKIVRNSAYTDGGGIYNQGTLAMSGVMIFENTVPRSHYGSHGGGIHNSGTLSMINGTVCGNSADGAEDGHGGGIYNAVSGALTLTNVTISGNSATGPISARGGGLCNLGTSSMTNVTVSANSVSGNAAASGGGVYNASGKTLNVVNSIVAGNTAPNGSDVSGLASSGSDYNLIGVLDPSQIASFGPQTIYGSIALPLDPKLGSLMDVNGMLVHSLLPSSPAINIGSNTLALDPAGNPLVMDETGRPRIVGGTVDMGAYEYQRRLLPISGTALKDRIELTSDAQNFFYSINSDPAVRVPRSLVTAIRIDAQGGDSLSFDVDLQKTDLLIQSDPASRDQLLKSVSQAVASRSIRTSSADGVHGLACILNQDAQGHPLFDTFAESSVDSSSILMKYTLNGDADLNGILDGSDYFLIDKGYLSRNLPNPPAGYRNGDFNYDGTIDGSDYFLIDKAFLSQRSPAAAAPMSAAIGPDGRVKKMIQRKELRRRSSMRTRAHGQEARASVGGNSFPGREY